MTLGTKLHPTPDRSLVRRRCHTDFESRPIRTTFEENHTSMKLPISRFAATAMAMLLLLASVFTTRQMFAQTTKGIVTGVVRDKSGAVISNAKVTVTGQDTGETRNTTSGSNGAYRVDAINPGR